jgi:hypothetical protein
MSDFTLAFRVEFGTHSVEHFQCHTIGNGDSYTMKLHVLDIERKLAS